MLQPKRTKFRKMHKGRIKGLAKGGFDLNFGTFGLKALDLLAEFFNVCHAVPDAHIAALFCQTIAEKLRRVMQAVPAM